MFRKNHPTGKRIAPIATMFGLPLVALTLASAAGAEPTCSTTFTPNSQVDQIFAQWDKPDSPGCALSVKKLGKIVYQRGYGVANLDQNTPITPCTVFHAASLAKQFTAMAIMILAGRGDLSLNDDAHARIPDLLPILKCPDPPHLPCPFTIRQMLQHVSGLKDQWRLLEMAGWRLSDDVVKQSDVLNLVARMKTLNFKPGLHYSYSNTNYTLAGLIAERVSRECLPDFVRKQVFEPLGMMNTTITKTHGEIVKNRAYGYRGKFPTFEIRMPNYDLMGPTNLLTTVEDLMRWDGNFDSKIVGGDAALEAMQDALFDNTPNPYGLGLFVKKENGHRIVWHDGRDAGYRSHLIRYTEKQRPHRHQLTVALLCNVALPDTNVALPATAELVHKVAAVYLGDLHDPPSSSGTGVAGPPGTPPSHLEEYVGRYYSDELDATYEIKQIGSSLKIMRPKDDPTELIPLASTTTITSDVFRARFSGLVDTARVRFSRDDDNKVIGFCLRDQTDPHTQHVPLFQARRGPTDADLRCSR